jgi:tRNA-intron endonuclease
MGIELIFEDKKVRVKDQPTIDMLRKSSYGYYKKDKEKGNQLVLDPEEALYLMDIRNAACYDGNKSIMFNDVAERIGINLAKYMTYKDWRDRGLVIRQLSEAKGTYKKNTTKKYPAKEFEPPKVELQGLFFPEDGIAIIDEPIKGRELYDTYWLGQFGSYKAADRGRLLKLDAYETVFMMKHCGLKLRDMNEDKIVNMLDERNPDFEEMYEVYEDWRLRGFVLKTGFKFGTHFRIYFPGAAPASEAKGAGASVPGAAPGEGTYMHSKHVIHVFPRKKKMIIAEWARAIRVAHSVRKTFILAIPGKKTKKVGERLSFLLYHRKKGGIEVPEQDEPSFAMFSLSEDEVIGGIDLAEAIEEAKKLGLDLMLAIADRESSVTYYHVKRIELPGSQYEYYEIEWAQP